MVLRILVPGQNDLEIPGTGLQTSSFLHSSVLSDVSMANWYMSKAPLGPSAPWRCPESHALPFGMDIENSPMFNIPLKGIVGAFLLIYLN